MLPETMTTNFIQALPALALTGLVFALGLPAHAATYDRDKSEAAYEKESRKEGPKRKAQGTREDLDTCKRDAEGMKGPERSRFMTACLKDR